MLASEKPDLTVVGNDFNIPATQQIHFVPQKEIDPELFQDSSLPRVVDLRKDQSKVKDQGPRGACTYFVITGLAENLIRQTTGNEIDISEEYLAWAAKTKLKMRSFEEDSSVAVNAAALQSFGFMLEADLPYQQSWFDKGMPCEGQRGKPDINPVCYSHSGPGSDVIDRIFEGKDFIFWAVGSTSIDVVRSLAEFRTPVTLSMLGHKEMWDQTYNSGDFYLTKKWKEECQRDRKLCSGHAILAVGYDLNKRVIYIKNSWGEKWGRKGYGTITFDYIDQMSDRKFMTGLISTENIPQDFR